MKKFAIFAALLAGTVLFGAEKPATVNNDVVIDLAKVPVTKTVTLKKAASEAGKIPVLKMVAFFKSPRPSGWTPAVSYKINKKFITAKTSAGTPRLLRNKQEFMIGKKATPFTVGNRWLTLYSVDGETKEPRLTKEGIADATTFNFDLTGLVPAEACDVQLTVTNILKITDTKKNMPLIIRNAEIVMMTQAEVDKLLGK